MANHPSAKKRHRQIVTRTARSRAVKSRVRTAVKRARIAITEGHDDAAELVRAASSLLDRAASKNVLPRTRVSRLKSRLATALSKAATAQPES